MSVDGVDVTFEQLRMWQDVKAAIDALEAQVVAGEVDVDLPPDVIRSLGAYQEIDRALRADVGPHLNAVAGAAVEAAAYAAAEREGVLPTAEQVNAEVELILSSYETSPAFSGFLERAQAEALGEAQYREWLPRHRAEVLARLNLSRLPAYGPEIVGPLAYDLALNAEISVHPSLGVTE
ncbi:MAG: hypothetical protein KC461_14480, partial [Dehalococcoidia bacterium]|nr:hypothetical protein [Dehalococcoidia bacterium]